MSLFKFRDQSGNDCEIDPVAGIMLSVNAEGRKVETRIERGDQDLERELTIFANTEDKRRALSAWEGRSVTMDLGAGDVHQASPLSNYASGYRNAEAVADILSPIVPSAKPSAKYYQWNSDDAFQAVSPTDIIATAGAQVKEVNPRLSNSTFTCVEYALGGFISTEIEAAADAPLQPMQSTIRRVLNALTIARESRVMTAVATYSLYSTTLVDNSGDSTLKWNGGSAADPVKDLHNVIEACYMEPTDIIMNRRVYNAFSRCAAVQKFITMKTGARPIPNPAEMSALLELPPITVSKMKVKGSTVDYIMGNNALLVRRPPAIPADGQDIASSYTYRWQGGATADGSLQGGMLVRTFFDQRRGPRGGMTVVVAHNDAEVLTSALVGGVVRGAYQ